MTDHAALLAAVLDEPAEDTHRLALADCLRESGDPADQLLGRWVWAGVTLAGFRGVAFPLEDPLYVAAVGELEAAGDRAVELRRWLTEAGLEVQDRDVVMWEDALDRVTVTFRFGNAYHNADVIPRSGRGVRRPPRQAVFERGMLCGLRLPFAAWLASARSVLDRWPLEWVEVNDVPGLTLRVATDTQDDRRWWGFSAELKLPRRVNHLHDVPAVILTEPGYAARSRDVFVNGVYHDSRRIWFALRDKAGDRWPGLATEDNGHGGGQGIGVDPFQHTAMEGP